MKERKLLIQLLFLTVLCCFCSCSPKTAITTESFTKTMEESGFRVSTYSGESPATEVLLAAKQNENYQLEFWVFPDNGTAENIFSDIKDDFNKEHAIQSRALSSSRGAYHYYAFHADEDFHLIVRIDNTMLYCETDEIYRNEILDLAEKLGYN